MNIFDLIIVQPIFNILIGIYSLIPGGDFGVALIIFTILVRLGLGPLVKKQLHQTKAMQKMQPELAKIKVAAKGNKQTESMMMMELYKKHDVSPFRSIGILFIQLPIFIALYQVIVMFTTQRNLVDKFTYDFMKGLEPVKELIAHPENFNENLFGFIDLTKVAISGSGINWILLVLVGLAVITQYLMSKQTMPKKNTTKKLRDIMSEAADGKQADQSEMNAIVMGKMTKVLPIMMFFVMMNLPGALVLYYTISNSVAILQQRSILKQDTEEMIEIADAAPVSGFKKATAKAREKQAIEGNVTRIVAKDNGKWQSSKKEKS